MPMSIQTVLSLRGCRLSTYTVLARSTRLILGPIGIERGARTSIELFVLVLLKCLLAHSLRVTQHIVIEDLAHSSAAFEMRRSPWKLARGASRRASYKRGLKRCRGKCRCGRRHLLDSQNRLLALVLVDACAHAKRTAMTTAQARLVQEAHERPGSAVVGTTRAGNARRQQARTLRGLRAAGRQPQRAHSQTLQVPVWERC